MLPVSAAAEAESQTTFTWKLRSAAAPVVSSVVTPIAFTLALAATVVMKPACSEPAEPGSPIVAT